MASVTDIVCRTCGEAQSRRSFRIRGTKFSLDCESCRDERRHARSWTPIEVVRLRRAGSAAVRLWKRHGDDFTEAEHAVIRELIAALDREDTT
ncbi:MAG: hypothetical protein M3Q71_14995 [Chloroflexota bacterium]|nr:hypothetical protein [Chloroflexota bacterium]